MTDPHASSVAYPRFAAVLVAVGLVLAAARILAVFNENLNWDEFALLERAVATVRTGGVVGGGRPGLGTLLLVSFAAECRNAVDALVQARVLWTVMVFGSAVAFWYLLRGVLPPSPHRWLAASTGLGLWVMAPSFLRFSTQVRTDQPAILFGLLGGLALLASRRRVPWALGAGALLGVGFLFSQKLVYVAGLVGTLAAGQLLIRGEWEFRRETLRAALTGLAFLLVVIGYSTVVGWFAATPTLLPAGGYVNVFEYYRWYIGWSLYQRMLPLVLPQMVAVVSLLMLTVVSLRDRRTDSRQLLVGWAVLLLALAVLLFHAARFPYFFLVLGLFPAAIGALAFGPLLERFKHPASRVAFVAALWLPMGALASLQAATLTIDFQSHQRESLAFVERNFARDARGFEGHGAFACRYDPNPLPVRFNQHVIAHFWTEDGPERGLQMLAEFRHRPVAFLILPIELAYPDDLWDFWGTRYVHYRGAVHVPGRHVAGPPGWTGSFEAVVPGAYVWRTTSGKMGSLEVAGYEVDPGGSVLLEEPGPHTLRLPGGGVGMLVLALPEPPAPDSTPFFRGF